MKKLLKMIPLLAVLSCATATSKIMTSWKDPGYQPASMQKVLAIAVAPDPNVRNRMETDFAHQLRDYGLEVFEAYTVVPANERLDKNSLTSAVKKYGIDTVLVTRLAEQQSARSYVPGSVAPEPGSNDDWYGFYSSALEEFAAPGYVVEDKVFVLQTNLYHTADRRLFWSATTQTTTGAGNIKAIQSFIKTATGKMKKDGLVS